MRMWSLQDEIMYWQDRGYVASAIDKAICTVLVTPETRIAETKACDLHRAIANNGFTNRAVVYYQMRMAGFEVTGL